MKIRNIEINWLGHSGILISGPKKIYIDPFQIEEGLPKADYIFLTHSHYDHCSFKDIKKILKENTQVLAPADCQSKLFRSKFKINFETIEENQERDFTDFKISTIPAYNTDKPFHPLGSGGIGYLVKLDEILIYHAGDTDIIPEMQKLTGHRKKENILIALLPISGKYTMSVEEAIEAVKTIKPSLAIPIHYGSVIGSNEDAKEFIQRCVEEGFDAKILGKKENE